MEHFSTELGDKNMWYIIDDSEWRNSISEEIDMSATLSPEEIEKIYRNHDSGVVAVSDASYARVIKNIRQADGKEPKIWEIYAEHLPSDEKKELSLLTDNNHELSNYIQYLCEAAFMHGYKKALLPR